MNKEITKKSRNPNTPEGIEARKQGLLDPTPFEDTLHLANNPDKYVLVDKTKYQVNQSINPSTSGKNFSKKLTRAILGKNEHGEQVLTLYYFDSYRSEWVIIKDFHQLSKTPESDLETTPNWPKSTYGGTFGNYGSSPRGETWRNEGRSVDKLREAQKRIFKTVTIDPLSDRTKHVPDDGQYDEEIY